MTAAQLDLLPTPPKPVKPVDPARAALWSRGLYNLASLLGKRDAQCRAFLGRLEKAAKGDLAALSELLERAVQARPDDPIPWLVAGARKIGGVDETDDPWGVSAWYAAAAGKIQDWPEDVYQEIMAATGMAPSWRGSLAPLAAWIEDGYRAESIVEVLRAAPGSAMDWKPGPVTSLRFYDGMVRRRAARWDPIRCEYRSGE